MLQIIECCRQQKLVTTSAVQVSTARLTAVGAPRERALGTRQPALCKSKKGGPRILGHRGHLIGFGVDWPHGVTAFYKAAELR
jgi:hypothetical protein